MCDRWCKTQNPQPQITKSQPYTLKVALFTLYPTPYTLHPAPWALNPQPHTQHPSPYTLYPAPYTLNPQPSTLNQVGAPPFLLRDRRGSGHISLFYKNEKTFRQTTSKTQTRLGTSALSFWVFLMGEVVQ